MSDSDSHLSDTEPADEVDQPRGDTGPEHGVAGEIVPHQDLLVPLYGLLSVGLGRLSEFSTTVHLTLCLTSICPERTIAIIRP